MQHECMNIIQKTCLKTIELYFQKENFKIQSKLINVRSFILQYINQKDKLHIIFLKIIKLKINKVIQSNSVIKSHLSKLF